MYQQKDENYKPLNISIMDNLIKLVKEFESLVSKCRLPELFDDLDLSDYRRGIYVGHDEMCDAIVTILDRCGVRQQRKAKFCSKEISSNQWRQLNLLVDCARDRWHALGSASNFYDDAYCRGYINAVLRMMDILGIDEKRVKEKRVKE